MATKSNLLGCFPQTFEHGGIMSAPAGQCGGAKSLSEVQESVLEHSAQEREEAQALRANAPIIAASQR